MSIFNRYGTKILIFLTSQECQISKHNMNHIRIKNSWACTTDYVSIYEAQEILKASKFSCIYDYN